MPRLRKGVTPAEFAQRRAQMGPILHGIAGFGLLQKKDYPNARAHYLKSDLSDLQNAFQLALCELETDPIDIAGFWHAVKAAQLAESQHNDAGVSQIAGYAKAKYKKYHGSTGGWDDFVLKSRQQTELPSQASLALVVLRAPTPCELAVEALDQNMPGSLGFADWEFILAKRDCSAANKIAADRVWLAIMVKQKDGAASLRLSGVKVIAASKDALEVAITDDNQDANKTDMHVTLERPMAKPPAVGGKVDVIGVITGYTPEPFMFRMERGEVAPAK